MSEMSTPRFTEGPVRPSNVMAPPARTGFDDRLLLREFTHRINNEFAAAIAIVSIAAARSTNVETKTALGAVERRLHGYAQVLHTLQIPDYGICVDVSGYLLPIVSPRPPSPQAVGTTIVLCVFLLIPLPPPPNPQS